MEPIRRAFKFKSYAAGADLTIEAELGDLWLLKNVTFRVVGLQIHQKFVNPSLLDITIVLESCLSTPNAIED